MNWRVPVIIAVLALLAWVGFEIGRAGSDIDVARTSMPNTLSHGQVVGKRLDGRAWSLDYDSVTMSPDGSNATISHIRDGRLHRAGKPDVLMKGDAVTVNTITNDLDVSGAVSFTEPLGGGRIRTFHTVGAHYSGSLRVLELPHTATITDDGATVTVAKATVNFRTGDITTGTVEGNRPGRKS